MLSEVQETLALVSDPVSSTRLCGDALCAPEAFVPVALCDYSRSFGARHGSGAGTLEINADRAGTSGAGADHERDGGGMNQ